MSRNLNPDQFFHGTTHNIADGMVRPADDVDKNVSEYSFGDPGDMSEGDHAFAIRNNENYAWHAAHTFHPNGRRPRVYEVEPAADMKPGPWNKEHPDFLKHHELDDADIGFPPHPDDIAEAEATHQDEWASKTGFPVKRRIDIMPGRQGTFPQVNWNRFKSVDAPRWGGDMNHPEDEQVQYGTEEHPGKRSRQPETYGPDESASRYGYPPPRRTGAALKAFMMGKPEPKPEDPQGRLF